MTEKSHSIRTRGNPAAWAILLSGFLSSLGVGVFSFAVPLASLDARVGSLWLGTGFAGFFLSRLLAGPLGGWWSDRGGPRAPLLWGFGLGALAPLAWPLHPSVSTLFFIQFVLGIVAGLVRPVGLAVLGAQPGSGSGWFRLHPLVANIALFIGPILGGVLYWNRTVEPVLVGIALGMVSAHLVVFALVPAGASTNARREEAGTERAAGGRFAGLLIAIFGRTFGIGLVTAFYPVLLSLRLGAGGVAVGVMYSLIGLSTCIGLPIHGWLRKRSGVDPILVGMLASGAGLMGVGFGTETWHFVLAGGVMGLGSGVSIPEAMTEASASMSGQGRAFGLAHLITGLGFLAGPLVGGATVQFSGDPGLPFIFAGLVGWVCLSFWARRGRENGRGSWNAPLLILLLAAAVAGGWLLARQSGPGHDRLYRHTDVAMGTVVNLTLEAASAKAADDAARKAMAFMRTLQQDYDFRYEEGSVGRINRAAGRSWVTPSKRAYGLLRRTLNFSAVTDGAFDPTIGAATTSPLYFALDKSLLEAKRHLVDYRLVRMDEATGRVRLSKEGMALDLGGVAKGAVIDATVALLRGLGVIAGIVEAGGDFYCFGDRDWTVGIRHPRDKSVYSTVSVREKGVCGSGDYEQFVVGGQDSRSGVRHHILDPSDMAPADESLGVTVIASSAEQADRLATALFIMGAQEGRRFLALHCPQDAAMWFNPDLSVVVTENFPH
ncbi:MAG: MFS transporter [Desulfovibrionaceae bacterium]|nr:MFS transporter [Desulfovibrionaceae bacterium]